jgi:hypothetical protein
MGAAPQLTSIIESALIATALRLSVSIARSTLPVTRPPIGEPEQSAALTVANTLYDLSGSCPRGCTVSAESLCSWLSFRVGAPETQELKAKTAIGKVQLIRGIQGALLFMCYMLPLMKIFTAPDWAASLGPSR